MRGFTDLISVDAKPIQDRGPGIPEVLSKPNRASSLVIAAGMLEGCFSSYGSLKHSHEGAARNTLQTR